MVAVGWGAGEASMAIPPGAAKAPCAVPVKVPGCTVRPEGGSSGPEPQGGMVYVTSGGTGATSPEVEEAPREEVVEVTDDAVGGLVRGQRFVARDGKVCFLLETKAGSPIHQMIKAVRL